VARFERREKKKKKKNPFLWWTLFFFCFFFVQAKHQSGTSSWFRNGRLVLQTLLSRFGSQWYLFFLFFLFLFNFLLLAGKSYNYAKKTDHGLTQGEVIGVYLDCNEGKIAFQFRSRSIFPLFFFFAPFSWHVLFRVPFFSLQMFGTK
jgi:phosphatidylglycerophosphatase A